MEGSIVNSYHYITQAELGSGTSYVELDSVDVSVEPCSTVHLELQS